MSEGTGMKFSGPTEGWKTHLQGEYEVLRNVVPSDCKVTSGDIGGLFIEVPNGDLQKKFIDCIAERCKVEFPDRETVVRGNIVVIPPPPTTKSGVKLEYQKATDPW